MRGLPTGFFLLLFASTSLVYAEEQVDVSRQWQEHASTTPVVSPSSAAVNAVLSSTAAAPSDCNCDSLTVQEKLAESTYAFTGIVDGISRIQKGRRTILLDVDEIFKGSPKPEIEIVTDVLGTHCDIPFEEGKKYLIYARWEWGRYVTSLCMGTKVIERARGDASALGPSESMKEKLYIHLRNSCMGRSDTSCCLASLKAMRQDYNVPEPQDGCPAGTKPDRMLCLGSYTWCIPVTATDHRESAH